MTDARDWTGRVGANWAREWARTDRSFAGLTHKLVERLAGHAASDVLDIGCGAGELSLRVGAILPGSRIMGIDLSGDLILEADARRNEGSNCRFAVADASQWRDVAFVPDLLMSRHGVMFFDDPIAAFTNLAQASAPDARLVFSCFRDRLLNSWATEIAALLPEAPLADPRTPGPFAFADQNYVATILEAAGWTDITYDPIDWDFIAGAGDDAIADAVDFFTRIGPAAPVIAALEGSARDEFVGQLQTIALRHHSNDVVSFPAAARIVSVRRRGV